MKQKRTFPPAPDRCWEDPEDCLTRVWALMAAPERDDKYASLSSSGGYRHLRFYFVNVVDTYDDDAKRIRNPGSDHVLGDLELHSQGNQFNPDELYGYGIHYKEVHHADVHKLGSMHQFLSTVERKLEALRQEHGEPGDYARYVVRVAQVLKVRYLIEERSKDASGWSSYDRGSYRFTHLVTDGKFNGRELLWKVQHLVSTLWTDDDRAKAKVYQAEKEQERKAREESAA